MRRWNLLVVATLAWSCSTEESRQRQSQNHELEEQIGWLYTESKPHLRHVALNTITSYCQLKAAESACRELSVQLVFGGPDAVEWIATRGAISLGDWDGKVPRVVWQVAYETAQTAEAKRAIRMASKHYKSTP